jgi:hypothetical protein
MTGLGFIGVHRQLNRFWFYLRLSVAKLAFAFIRHCEDEVRGNLVKEKVSS